MSTPLFSKKILKKYPEIGKYISIVYDVADEEYDIYTTLTDHFSVNDLSELTDEKIEQEIKREKEKREFQDKFFPESWQDSDFENAILRSVLANCK